MSDDLSPPPVPARAAHVIGLVEYREGDGPNIVIRPGPVQVQATAIDATLSWTDGQTHGAAAMPIADFNRLLVEGHIQWAA